MPGAYAGVTSPHGGFGVVQPLDWRPSIDIAVQVKSRGAGDRLLLARLDRADDRGANAEQGLLVDFGSALAPPLPFNTRL